MRYFGSLPVVAAIFAISFNQLHSQEASQADSSSGYQEVSVPSDVKSDGAFRYFLPFEAPEFRDLLPSLGISYNSASKGHGQEENYLGTGWQLSGFSTIERVSQGGGIPTYDDGHDLYRLDGQELLVCSDVLTRSPAAWGEDPDASGVIHYPSRYVTSNTSASCLAGGNLAPLVENHNKIRAKLELYYNSAQQQFGLVSVFEVTQPNGNLHRYESIGQLAGAGWADDTSRNILFGRKWLLTEIRDTQTNANIVSIEYQFGSDVDQGMPSRPSKVSYGNGYEIEFHYENRFMSSYAIGGGKGFRGQQDNRLSAVTIQNGTAKIRAYDLIYNDELAQTPTGGEYTGVSLLNKVDQYGDDYVVFDAQVVAGSKLPSPLSDLTYSTEAISLGSPLSLGREIQASKIWIRPNEISPDGDTYFSTGLRANTCHPLPDLYGFTIATDQTLVSVVDNEIPTVDPNASPTEQLVQIILSLGIGPFGDMSNRYEAATDELRGASALWISLDQEELPQFTYNKDGEFLYRPELFLGIAPEGGHQVNFGNFDTDNGSEVLFEDKVYDVSNSGFSLRTTGLDLDLSPHVLSADIDGDGVEELMYPGPSEWQSAVYEDNDPHNGELITPGGWKHKVFKDNETIGDFRDDGFVKQTGYFGMNNREGMLFADVNGDGAADLVTREDDGSNPRVSVGYSAGIGFNQLFFASSGIPHAHSHFVADVNGDGLADLITVDTRRPTTFCGGEYKSSRFVEKKASIRFSDGLNFGSVAFTFDDFVALGDFDRDGRMDFLREGQNGSIFFQQGNFPNLLTSFKNASGGTTSVEYTPSFKFNGSELEDGTLISEYGRNRIPYASQVVSAIEVDGGQNNSRRTEFEYFGGRYDFDNRKSLGFATVVAKLPAIAGEGWMGPRVVTNYLRAEPGPVGDHLAQNGRVKSRFVFEGGKLWSAKINEWDVVTNGNGPYSATKTVEATGVRFSSIDTNETPKLLWTKRAFETDDFGQRTRITDFGFVAVNSNSTTMDAEGTFVVPTWDIDPDAGADSVITERTYARDLAAYIVDRPSSATVLDPQSGNTILNQTTYFYDGSSDHTAAPVTGNLTRVDQGDGVDVRTVTQRTYDTYGNVLTETDARGHSSTYTYDPLHHLFRISETNAKGHSSSTFWDDLCQAPLSVTDTNGLVASFTYDSFCREISRSLPGGQVVQTDYLDFGDPTLQRIRKTSKSAAPGDTDFHSIEIFDGFGEVYRVIELGGAGPDLVETYQEISYDKRGNKAWETIPLAYADWQGGQASDFAGLKTTFAYDPLGRVLQTMLADGTITTAEYGFETGTGTKFETLDVPSVRTMDARCNDGDADTVCGVARDLTDSRGQKIAQVMVEDASEVTGHGSSDHATTFAYDLLGRMTGVKDPVGAEWVYEYDAFGNRTTASDPGLGYWTLSYDDNNNLLEQIDANNQRITFTYDELNRVLTKTVADEINVTQSTIESCYDSDICGHVAAFGAANIGQLTDLSVRDAQNTEIHRIEYDYGDHGQVIAETHHVDGDSFTLSSTYTASGAPNTQSMPLTFGATVPSTLSFTYDVASRLTGVESDTSGVITGLIADVTYDVWGNPSAINYGNGASELRTHDPQRGWLNSFEIRDTGSITLETTTYTRSADGRVLHQETGQPDGRFDYAYDYAGRLLSATNTGGLEVQYDQAFTYDSAGRMLSNSHVGTYLYGADLVPGVQGASPHTHAPAQVDDGVAVQNFAYDNNGNMTAGLGGKVMTYDAENRPLSVDDGTNLTTYVYGADGTRLKKIEKTGQGAENTTLYVGPLEIRDYGTGNESLIAYPHPNIRMVDGVPSALHKDQLNSVRMITNAAGGAAKESIYKPFGEATDWTPDPTEAIETKGFIGERYDADSGLQYLNARYYDPKLSLFIQPDWFEVTKPGVGTNRYSYSFNDPINNMDPGGNSIAEAIFSDQEERDDTYQSNIDKLQEEIEKLRADGYPDDDPVIRDLMSSVEFNRAKIGQTGWQIVKKEVGAALFGWGAGKAASLAVGSAAKVAGTLGGKAAVTNNPVPETLARVIPANVSTKTLGAPGTPDVFVTDAAALAGKNADEIAELLTIPKSTEGFKIIEFSSETVEAIFTPINRSNPGFLGFGKTAGGLPEFGVPNGPIPPDAVVRIVK